MTTAITRCLLILCLSTIASGCAKDSLDPHVRAHLEKPEWVSGDSEKYPAHTFVIGRSVSARLSQAKRQSVDDLAANLEKQIFDKPKRSHHSNRFSEENDDAESTEKGISETEILTHLDQKTQSFLLQHVRIAKVWQDPATLAYHVLSTIDRLKVGDLMLNEVYRLDEQVERILKKASAEKDVLQRVAFANLAIEKHNEREKLQAVVAIVKPIANKVRSNWNEKEIRQQISKWLNEIKIMPVAQHKEFNLMSAVKDGVTSAGMSVHFGAKPDYILKETFNQGQVKWKDGVYSLEGNLQLELFDGKWKGQVRGDANWPIEVSALERDQLPQQLAEAIKKAHQKNLRSTLLSLED